MISDRNAKLEDILITDQLFERKREPLNFQRQKDAFIKLARETSYGPNAILQTLCQLTIELCDAGSAGVAILGRNEERECFNWAATAGQFADYCGIASPRDHSPFGVCVTRDAAQLFSHPARYFTWMTEMDAPVVESLVIPLHGVDRQSFGTIWIMSHDEQRQFDSEDLRVMTALGNYGAIALRLQISLNHHVRC
jgi:GAF domain-containing protein